MIRLIYNILGIKYITDYMPMLYLLYLYSMYFAIKDLMLYELADDRRGLGRRI